MPLDQTQQLIDRYFEVIGANGDFSGFYLDGATWTMVDAGAEIRGAYAVRDYIIALHHRCPTYTLGGLSSQKVVRIWKATASTPAM